MTVQTIVFDLGNVLWDCDMLSFVRRYAANQTNQALLFRELFRSVEWAMLDRGAIAAEAALLRIQARLPAHLHEPARVLLFHWYDLAQPFPGMEALIRRLHANGYPLYVLSNIHPMLREKTGLLPAADCFSGFFLSCEHGLVKPDPRIYHLFCKTYALDPAACLFIDDSPYNIDSAELIGMPGIVFHMDAADLAEKLLARGVLV